MSEDRTPKSATKEFLAERDLRMFKMRQAGVAVNEIARRFGVSTKVVSRAMSRQLEKLNSEALLAYPEVLRMELERLDALQQAIWPMTQFRKVTMDDGTEIQAEPDMKAIQQVLSIMDRRAKLLGMEQNNVNIQMDVSGTVTDNIRVSLAGANDALPVSTFNPETEARQLLELMVKSGVLAGDEIKQITQKSQAVEAVVIEDDDE